jgi:DNA segregation ATPase FtsK/SpoIIIE, S-DNA-T family
MNANQNHDDHSGVTGDAIAEEITAEFTELFGDVPAGPDDALTSDLADDLSDGLGDPDEEPRVAGDAPSYGHHSSVPATDPDVGGVVADVDDGESPVPVDPPGSDRVRLADRIGRGERRPVLPPWARSVSGVRSGARWVAGHYAHTAAYHGVRVPVYVTRLAVRAPVGALRVTAAGVRWLGDAEGVPVRQDVVRRADAEMYLKLIRHRDARVRARSLLATFAALASLVVVLLMASGVLSVPWVPLGYGAADVSLWWPLLAVLVGALGVVGSPADKPIAGPAVLAPAHTRLTADVVIRALGALGIAEINKVLAKSMHGITFPAPIMKDGPGWRAEIDLPYGVTVTDILDRRDKLASGLRRPLGCVWPEPAHDVHAGRLVLWVGDEDMSQARAMPWPLAKGGAADLFKPIPFGQDQRGRLVSVELMFSNLLIGAMPRIGKTFALKPFVLAAGLDPSAECHVFELKGSGDLAFAQKYAHRYASGSGDATIAEVMVSLRETYRDLEVRGDTITAQPREVCPENKVTPALARRRHLGLFPKVIAIDECQELFSHPNFGKEAGDLCTAIVKRGPAFGVILLLATQRPDKESLPTGISANIGIRFCLRVMGQVENDMVLGTSAYRNGLRATVFTRRDKGIGYLLGASDDPQIVRTAYLDAPAAERIADRARAARTAAGLLTGYAIGEMAPAMDVGASVLDDILSVIPAGEDRVWSETLTSRLSELRPDVYTGWEPEQITAALKPYGVETRQIQRTLDGGQRINRRGVHRADLENAVTERNRSRDAS